MAKQQKDSKKSDQEESSEGKQSLSPAEKSHSKQDPPPTLLEWSIRGLSLLIVVGILGYLVYSGLQPTSRPLFDFEVQTEELASRNGKWVVPVNITNQGDMSVHTLVVSCKSLISDQERSLEIALLGSGASVTGEFWFDQQQDASTLEFSVESYVLP